MNGNNMKNITPIEIGKTIVGILPDITSDEDVAAKDTMYRSTSVMGLFAYSDGNIVGSMLMSAYFSAKRVYVDIKTSTPNQTYDCKKPFIRRLVSPYTMDRKPEMNDSIFISPLDDTSQKCHRLRSSQVLHQ